jgi:hypothetical protein
MTFRSLLLWSKALVLEQLGGGGRGGPSSHETLHRPPRPLMEPFVGLCIPRQGYCVQVHYRVIVT